MTNIKIRDYRLQFDRKFYILHFRLSSGRDEEVNNFRIGAKL